MTLEFFITYLLPLLIVLSAIYSIVDIILSRRKGQKKWYQIPIMVVDALLIVFYGVITLAALISTHQ
jgi:hypothetical protein